MGILSTIGGFLGIGGGKNAIVETIEVFRPNAENSAQREADANSAVQAQYASEFHTRNNRGLFDQFVDGMNRLVRPMIVYSMTGILVYTPFNIEGMSAVFLAWAVLPAGFWVMYSGILAFYFGGRMQVKAQDFKAQLSAVATRAPAIIAQIRELQSDSPNVASDDTDLEAGAGDNPAVNDWKANG